MRTAVILTLLLPAAAFCQPEASKNVVKTIPGQAVNVKAGSVVRIPLFVRVDEGYHVNSNAPAEAFLIPLRLTWNPGVIESGPISFPKPQLERLGFSEKPVSVFKGAFEITTRFKVPADAKPGSSSVTGKLHYQACNDRTCLTPRNLDVSVPIEIVR